MLYRSPGQQSAIDVLREAAVRLEYLQLLAGEFQRSPDILRKEEVVANLANFTTDPIKYGSLARLRILDLFLDILDADQEHKMVEISLGSICNCIPDPTLQQQVIDGEGIDIISPYILDFGAQRSVLTTAYFLLDSSAFADITAQRFMTKMRALQQHSIVQVANAAAAFLSRNQELHNLRSIQL
ncbi:hypothetical protein PHYSODRAFT_311467 [Phytophthora sojae]|uniref:Armadillo repeat-containing domain-containing protein n=1 Tax=Phytophthora sojae (strain P6497) TaxID=1094619 RepID=G4YXQ3_PHYSP|nr:hypothetical protein PHYSODRAFT_311467 [Phytophthora sojae]EGZ24542.1 hypothetical protein PHYSODRAFT_311467 [Phytophthora sojae]|eukprot:XP_009519830.1 hypothetical protein PHYSODRAFT_311467 [Phytophthora sojae]